MNYQREQPHFRLWRVLPTRAFALWVALTGLAVVSSSCLYLGRGAPVRTDPVRFVDAATGAEIREVLIVPLYNSFLGAGIVPEGPARGSRRGYLASPFVYRAGTPFIPRRQKDTGLMWGPVYTGTATSLDGVFVFAPRYRRQWFTDLWPRAVAQRTLQLTPSSDEASSRELQVALDSLQKHKLTIPDECSFWEPSSACPLHVRLKARERELVRSFIRQAVETLTQP